ncbi:hypothetical protein VFPBJ_11392 [Purpureocillium lilacinum]|uniref:Uncharacterized protein n=1 Tax=Purpureocillium lilacinum TaxID=33203 RepID=A0A179FBA7_PURLI|nr:hypothetical protein VFPBJ_11392 [Purpureocillium lilacinum]
MQVVRPGAGRMDSHVTESRTPVHKSPGRSQPCTAQLNRESWIILYATIVLALEADSCAISLPTPFVRASELRRETSFSLQGAACREAADSHDGIKDDPLTLTFTAF